MPCAEFIATWLIGTGLRRRDTGVYAPRPNSHNRPIHTTKLRIMTRTPKTVDTRSHSRLVVEGLKQAPARAMLHAVGFADGDFDKPQIGIASTWSNLTPCNMHIDELARLAAAGVEAHGAKAVTFATITVSDGIS